MEESRFFFRQTDAPFFGFYFSQATGAIILALGVKKKCHKLFK